MVRVRYAPSPTGLQHIGGIRTALFNYLFAKQAGGSFILRVEDTDQKRYNKEALEDLYFSLNWLGLPWDEGPKREGNFGPYFQSHRLALYQKIAQRLLEKGAGYSCFCSQERLERIRAIQAKNKRSTGYDRHCRSLTDLERVTLKKELAQKGERPVIRLKVPLEGFVEFQDLVLGRLNFECQNINPDPVLIKADGFPTYHFANVVDDHAMQISHVIRAQEWLVSTPLHILLYRALGLEHPVFCHLPMVMGSDGQKLSKRHGATSVREFRKQGYLPEALLNYISLLGWSLDGKTEFFTQEDLKVKFSKEGLHKASAVFDYKKLNWFNSHYIRKRSDKDIFSLVLPYLKEAHLIGDSLSKEQEDLLFKAMPLLKERLNSLSEAPRIVDFLLREHLSLTKEQLLVKSKNREEAQLVLKLFWEEVLPTLRVNTQKEQDVLMKKLIQEHRLKPVAFFMPIRLALTGHSASLPLLEVFSLMSVDLIKRRTQVALGLLKEQS